MYRNRIPFLILLALPFALYWPLIAFPSLLMDDNWLLRGWPERGYPTKGFIAFLQGRPFLMVTAWLWSFPVQWFGEVGVQLFRVFGLAMLGGCACLLYLYARQLRIGTAFAFLAAAIWITLPSVQVVAADGSYLTIGVAAAFGAVLVLLRPWTWRNAALAAVLIWIAAGTYQPTALLVPALYILTLPVRGFEFREVARRLALIALALIVYFVAWKIAFMLAFPGAGEARYNPNATISLAEIPQRLRDQFDRRFHQLSTFWDIENSFARVTVFVYWALGIAGVVGAVVWLRRGFKLWPVVGVLIVWPLAFLISELSAIPSKALIFSYTTAIGGTTVLALGIASVLSLGFGWLPVRLRLAGVAAVVIFAGFIGATSVARHFAIPTWLNAQTAKTYALKRIAEKSEGPLVLCVIGQNRMYDRDGGIPAYGVQEFTWSNFTHSFYVYWHMRTMLDMMGKKEPMVALFRDSKGIHADETFPVGTAAPTCKPEDFLNLSKQTKRDLFG